VTDADRIAQLEAALALERAKVRELTATVEQIARNVTEADSARARTLEEDSRSKALRRERNRRHREAKKMARETLEDVSVASHETSHLPPPLKGSPPPSAPSSPSPISSPPSLFPSLASQAALPAKKARKAKEGPPDHRHAPLVKALVGIGFPWDSTASAMMAATVSALLSRADEVPATAGEAAQAEVLRRGRIALAQTGYNSARSLPEFRRAWDRFAEPERHSRGPAPPSSDADFAKPLPDLSKMWDYTPEETK